MIFELQIRPSEISLLLIAIFIIIIYLLFISNLEYFNKFKYYQKIIILSILTLIINIHGINHLGYDLYPYKWTNS
jgi:hypothetical protein